MPKNKQVHFKVRKGPKLGQLHMISVEPLATGKVNLTIHEASALRDQLQDLIMQIIREAPVPEDRERVRRNVE